MLINIIANWNNIELLAVIFSICYVILAAKKKITCWFFAIISVSLYIYICYLEKLYAETILQFFYLIMAFYGLKTWNKEKSLKINDWKISTHLIIFIIGSILTFISGFTLSHFTDSSLPTIDSFTTIFSIIATYMVIKRVLSNWLYWIIIDLVSIYIYDYKELYLTALLFIIYAIIAIFGYFNWLKISAQND